MRKLLFNAAMLIGALLLCAPWAMAQGGATTVKLTLEKKNLNTGVTVVADKTDVEANGTVTITFTGEPAADKKFAVEGKSDTDKANVTVSSDATGKIFTVTVKAAATVVATEVAKGGAPQPEAPNFDITTMISGATVVVKEGTTELNQEALKTIAAGKDLTITVTVPPTKELVKVEIKKGEDLKALTAETDGSYKYTTTIDKVILVVTTKEKEAPAAGYELVIVNGGAQVKVMKKGETTPLTPAQLKNIVKGTDLEITVTTDPKKLAIEKVEVKEDGAKAATPLTGKAGKYTYKMGDKKTTLTVITKKVTPVEDAVLAAVAVYPNPFAGELVVANTTEVAKVALVNAQGVVVRTVLPNGANELRLAVEDLPAGVYVLVLERADARKAIRLVK